MEGKVIFRTLVRVSEIQTASIAIAVAPVHNFMK